jgi:hypothetical protein
MTFRAQAIADLPVFLNTTEFADTLLLEGDSVACVLVEDETERDPIDGVTALEGTLYARVSDLFDPPIVQQRLSIRDALGNDRQANVLRVDNEQGMWVIRLRWFNS